MRILFKALTVILLVLFGSVATAQESENGALVGWIEGKLSTPNRIIKIRDIEGALSSEAQIGSISISDADGVWLQIDDAQINWKRSALLSGSLQIESLTAAVIKISRAPLPDQSLPTPEAGGFSLPELPLDINISKISASQIILGQELFGLAAELSATASARLDAIGMALEINAIRLDGAGGQVALAVEYTRTDATFAIDVSLQEPENGVIANALNLEGRPAVDARISGQGPLDDLAVVLAIDAAGATLIDGDLRIGQNEEGRTFVGQIDGQFAPLVPREYRGFFAGNSSMEVEGLLRSAGGLLVPRLTVKTADMVLNGNMETTEDGFPSHIQLNVEIGHEDDSAVILPIAGGLSLSEAKLDLSFGQAEDGVWGIRFTVKDLSSETISAHDISGHMLGNSRDLDNAYKRTLSGILHLDAQGLSAEDENIAQALGQAIDVDATWDWAAQGPLMLRSARIRGANADLQASGSFSGLDFNGDISGKIAELAVLAPFVGRPLSGGIAFQSTGRLALLGGEIDTQISGSGQDISISDPRVDGLLVGNSTFVAGIKRDETGVSVSGLSLRSDAAKIDLDASLDSEAVAVTGSADLVDLSTVLQGIFGPGRIEFSGAGPIEAFGISANLSTKSGTRALVTGTIGHEMNLTGKITDFPLSFLHLFAANLALEGHATGDVFVTGTMNAAKVDFDITAINADAGLLKPYSLGALSLKAKGTYFKREVLLANARIEGRDGFSVSLVGRVPFTLENIDVGFSGSAPLSFASAILARSGVAATGKTSFDLRLRGSTAVPEFYGAFALRDGRVVVHRFKVRFDQVNVAADASGRTIAFSSVTAKTAAGGDIQAQGHVELSTGFPGVLEIQLNDAEYSDGRLFSIVFDGDLVLEGLLANDPTLRGEIELESAEIRVPNGSNASAVLLDVTHYQPPTPVRRTLDRAGLSPAGGNASSDNASMILDVAITSPSRIYVRGRGLDAELGGAMRITGASPDTRANGRFELIRGRMDLLGQRLEFTEGAVTLNGKLDPQLDFLARTKADDLDITIRLAGVSSAPELTLSSVPELPEDEILARLIFSRGIDDLSIFQIAQLASAVADLSGRSSGGLVSQLRQLAGLDNLDIRTVDGETSVAAGKYLQENIYSEIEIGTSGETRFSINLDVMDNVKARAGVSSDGDSDIGIFFEKDY